MKIDHNSIPPIIVIGGPTATGKSSLGLTLAEEFKGIIINADSKQVYKELQIGTARPIPDEMNGGEWLTAGISHYLYGHVSIFDDYNLKQYQDDCFNILQNVDPSIPVFLIGGTGLYINSIIYNYSLKDSSPQNSETLESLSISELQEILGSSIKKLNQSDRNNKRRLIKTITRGFDEIHNEELDHMFLYLDVPKDDVNRSIRSRTEQMFTNGLLNEVLKYKKEIINEDHHFDIIGYKEFKDFFEDRIDLNEVKELIILHTIQYAKRQRTWFRNKTKNFSIHSIEDTRPYIENFLNS